MKKIRAITRRVREKTSPSTNCTTTAVMTEEDNDSAAGSVAHSNVGVQVHQLPSSDDPLKLSLRFFWAPLHPQQLFQVFRASESIYSNEPFTCKECRCALQCCLFGVYVKCHVDENPATMASAQQMPTLKCSKRNTTQTHRVNMLECSCVCVNFSFAVCQTIYSLVFRFHFAREKKAVNKSALRILSMCQWI